jgi:hypothetical protein
MNSNIEINSKNESKQYILDPLSVIIKLAIISKKNNGTKISISNNILYIQDFNILQPFIRYYFKSNKSDLNFLYNPIELACKTFLNSDKYNQPSIKHLFQSALRGLAKLKETYKKCSIIIICLNFYSNLIINYLGKTINEKLFKNDEMSCYYTDELVEKLNKYWTADKIVLVLEMTEYLFNNDSSVDGIKCLEVFMKGVDSHTYEIIN